MRAVAPDLVGFGKSDKPTAIDDYSYQQHMDWLTEWLVALDLRDITLVCQDWGSLLGLRLAAEQGERFSRIVVANGFLPDRRPRRPCGLQDLARLRGVLPGLPGRADRRHRHQAQAQQGRGRGVRRPVPDLAPQGGRARLPAPGADHARRTRPCRPTARRGAGWGSGTSRSSPSSVPATRSWARRDRPLQRARARRPGPAARPALRQPLRPGGRRPRDRPADGGLDPQHLSRSARWGADGRRRIGLGAVGATPITVRARRTRAQRQDNSNGSPLETWASALTASPTTGSIERQETRSFVSVMRLLAALESIVGRGRLCSGRQSLWTPRGIFSEAPPARTEAARRRASCRRQSTPDQAADQVVLGLRPGTPRCRRPGSCSAAVP